MAHRVETMAYANEVPWHGLGKPVKDTLSPKQMMKAAGLNWTVSKRPVFLEGGKEVPAQYALCRDTDDKFLSMVGATYKPVQNEEVLDFFKRFTKAGHMKMETAGSLAGGQFVWALAKLDAGFKLGRNDEVQGHLLLCQPHIRGKALLFQTTAIRVVCWNTLTFAVGADLKGGKSAFRMSHSTAFTDEVKEKAVIALGLATDQMETFKDMTVVLSRKKATKEKVEEYFCEVLKHDPKKAKEKIDGSKREPNSLPKFREALEYAPGATISTAAGTWWGALNAVTYVIDHETGRSDRGIAMRNAWLGNTAGIKRRALDLALQYAA